MMFGEREGRRTKSGCSVGGCGETPFGPGPAPLWLVAEGGVAVSPTLLYGEGLSCRCELVSREGGELGLEKGE